MQIIFQKNKFIESDYINKFSLDNKNSGAIFSFIGKVRPKNQNNNVLSIDIELYEKMAHFQIKKIINKLMKKYLIDDYLVVHRYGRVKPRENIVLIVVASQHRKESFRFGEGLMDWLKVKATFWKKENFAHGSEWVNQKETDKEFIDFSL